MKPLVIYHANCTDGFGAAFAAWMKLGDEAEYLPAAYGDKQFSHPADIREMVDGREVYILDFSFPKPVMEQIITDAQRVVWLDHHKTAFEMWCGRTMDRYEPTTTARSKENYVLLDDNKSGALLAWEYFHPGTTVPMLIQHIDDRDRWVFALDGSKEMHAYLQTILPWSFEQWQRIFTVGEKFLVDEEIPYLISLGEAVVRAQEIMVEQQAKQDICCGIKNGDNLHIGLAVNTQNHISETGHALANKSSTYGLLWYVGADGKVKCSLRSNGDYDVSAIAKAFGGGGHRNAAGFETDLDTLKGWLA